MFTLANGIVVGHTVTPQNVVLPPSSEGRIIPVYPTVTL